MGAAFRSASFFVSIARDSVCTTFLGAILPVLGLPHG